MAAGSEPSAGAAAVFAASALAAAAAMFAGYGALQTAVDEWTLRRAERIRARRKVADEQRALLKRRAWAAGAVVVAAGLAGLWLRSEFRRARELQLMMAVAHGGVPPGASGMHSAA
jgi:hypothetical protein